VSWYRQFAFEYGKSRAEGPRPNASMFRAKCVAIRYAGLGLFRLLLLGPTSLFWLIGAVRIIAELFLLLHSDLRPESLQCSSFMRGKCRCIPLKCPPRSCDRTPNDGATALLLRVALESKLRAKLVNALPNLLHQPPWIPLHITGRLGGWRESFQIFPVSVNLLRCLVCPCQPEDACDPSTPCIIGWMGNAVLVRIAPRCAQAEIRPPVRRPTPKRRNHVARELHMPGSNP
jgi:hypothetical protein